MNSILHGDGRRYKGWSVARLLEEETCFRDVIAETHPENPAMEGHTSVLYDVEQEIKLRLTEHEAGVRGAEYLARLEKALVDLVKAIPLPRSQKAQAPFEAAMTLASEIEGGFFEVPEPPGWPGQRGSARVTADALRADAEALAGEKPDA